MTSTRQHITDLTDEEIVEELGRTNWYMESRSSTRAEVDIAILREGVRRILKNQLLNQTNENGFRWKNLEAGVVYKIVVNYKDIDTGYNPWI